MIIIFDSFVNLAINGAVKDGSSGSIVFRNKIIQKIEPFHANAIDTTGAGDIYAAGFIFGLVKGKTLQESGKRIKPTHDKN